MVYQKLQLTIWIIAAVVVLCLMSCDTESDVSSISPWDDINNAIEADDSPELLFRVSVLDLTIDNIMLAELRYGYGIYSTAVKTTSTKSFKGKNLTVDRSSDTSGCVSFTTNVIKTKGNDWFFDIWLYNNESDVVGNLKKIWQNNTSLAESTIIDVTCDGLYGDMSISYWRH